MSSFVYVLTNPAMPGIVKIGYTDQSDVNVRIAQLYTSGVPVPFEVAYAVKVENAHDVEDALHTAFGPQRVNSQREFFRIDPEQAIVILRLFSHVEATSEASVPAGDVNSESVAARERLKERNPNIDFQEIGIPLGAILNHTRSTSTITVVGPRRVKLGDTEMSFSAATRAVNAVDYTPAPALYWTYQGRLVREIYLAYHEE